MFFEHFYHVPLSLSRQSVLLYVKYIFNVFLTDFYEHLIDRLYLKEKTKTLKKKNNKKDTKGIILSYKVLNIFLFLRRAINVYKKKKNLKI